MSTTPETYIREAVAVSKLKVEWAKQHINGVEDLVKTVIADNANVVTIHNDAERATVFVGPKEFLPVGLVLHLGDAIHNLNSITDYLWTGLAKAALTVTGGQFSEEDITRVSFPRDETGKQLAGRVKNPSGLAQRAIYQAFPQAERFILNDIQPCKRPDDPSLVWTLNKLDNVNKHRLILATAYVLSFEDGLVLEGSDGGMVDFGTNAIQTKGHPLTVGLTPPVKIHHEPKPIIDVVFAEPQFFNGEPVVETLVNVTNAVSELIKAFEKTFT